MVALSALETADGGETVTYDIVQLAYLLSRSWRRDGLWVEMTDVVSVSSILARTHPSLDDIFQHSLG